MAGPVPPYLTTQMAAQTAFVVPFGLLALVNSSITTATAAGEFNTTVDCSLFTAEDVSNLRIYLDSEGYKVAFARDSNQKSLNIDWATSIDVSGASSTVFQGTSPWIVAGTVTANQGTSPWVVSGTISTSPDVNVHDGTGNPINSTSGSLDVDVTNTVPVTLISTTITGNVTVIQPTGSNLHVDIDNFPATQPVSGTVGISSFPTPLQTYSAAISGLAVSSAPNDIFTITGSGTKTIKILRIIVSATRTTSADTTLVLMRRSSADTGGTSTTLTPVPHDSANAAATATVRAYTANPTVGTFVGNIRADQFFINAAATGASDYTEWTFDSSQAQPLTLRGTSEVIALGLPATPIAGSFFDISVDWTEA